MARVDLLRMVKANTPDGDARPLLFHRMQHLVSALPEVMGVTEDGVDEAVRCWAGQRC